MEPPGGPRLPGGFFIAIRKIVLLFKKTSRIFALLKDTMRIISRSKIIAYYTGDPNSRTALEEWFQKAREADWMCFADMKRTFRSVDSVGNQHFVFNIHGNSYRLVAVVKFTIRTVYIRFIGTHSEYDSIDVKNI